MNHIASLIGAPGRDKVTNALSDAAWQVLHSLGANPGKMAVLAEGDAVEIPFADVAPAAARQSLVELVYRDAIDVAVTSDYERRKQLLVADMDSTIITVECIDELADFAGIKDNVATITEKAMRGELEFEEALRDRVALLEGLQETDLARVLEERIDLTPGARTLVQTMNKNGAQTCLVSGGFTVFTGPIADKCGFHHHQGNILLTDDGKLTGRVQEPILGQEAKLQNLISYRDKFQLLAHETLAVGDGANDLAMIKEAGLGVAFRAKPIVAQQADAVIVHSDLTSLLYLQGYQKSEFADS